MRAKSKEQRAKSEGMSNYCILLFTLVTETNKLGEVNKAY